MPDYDQVTKIQEQLTLLGIEAWALYSFQDEC